MECLTINVLDMGYPMYVQLPRRDHRIPSYLRKKTSYMWIKSEVDKVRVLVKGKNSESLGPINTTRIISIHTYLVLLGQGSSRRYKQQALGRDKNMPERFQLETKQYKTPPISPCKHPKKLTTTSRLSPYQIDIHI